MIQIVLINESSDPRITDEFLGHCAEAFTKKNARDFVPVWGSETACKVVSAKSEVVWSPGAWLCHIQDTLSDAPGALAYHDEENDVPVLYAEVKDALSLLKPDAKVLSQAAKDMISTAIDHEICEALVDPDINLWVDLPSHAALLGGHEHRGEAYETPKESADAVEGNSYPITCDDGTVVACTNFLKPAWFDGEASGTVAVGGGSAAPYDMLGVLSEPFSLAAGGYATVRDSAGTYSTVWGKRVNEAKKAAVLRRGRVARRHDFRL